MPQSGALKRLSRFTSRFVSSGSIDITYLVELEAGYVLQLLIQS